MGLGLQGVQSRQPPDKDTGVAADTGPQALEYTVLVLAAGPQGFTAGVGPRIPSG